MNVHIVTLFPEFFDTPLRSGLMGRALESGLVRVDMVNPRDFTHDNHRSVDDRPYGGGPGMVMLAGPVSEALRSIERPGRMLLLSPKGRPLDQDLAKELCTSQDLTLVCGRYEGLDARLERIFPLEPVSVGDFVLNGGEAGALCLLEAAARLVPGFMGRGDSADEESFSQDLLEHPHYTRPEEFEDLKVPEVLLSGDHGRIKAWRREASLRETALRRPDLLARVSLTERESRLTGEWLGPRLGRGLYIVLLHYPVVDKLGEVRTMSLTNLDLHDIGRVSCTYGLGGFFAATPLEDQRELAERLLSHWTTGPGAKANPDRAEALSRISVVQDLDEAVLRIQERSGQRPWIVATSARPGGDLTVRQVRRMLQDQPVCLILGTGRGLAPQVIRQAHGTLASIRGLGGYNHLSVRSAASILVDRILGDTD
jgi:tRNA (guanine37-N1)-methyltransferase